jgi:hypothetical protein
MDTLLIAIGCCGLTCAVFGRLVTHRGDAVLRAALALVSLVVLFHPDDTLALATAVIVLPATIYGTLRHRRIAPPKSALQQMPVS